MCDHLISATKHRDHVTANQLKQKIVSILTNKHGAWGTQAQRWASTHIHVHIGPWGSHVRSLTWVVAASAEDSKGTCSQISAVTVLDHQLIPFSQDPIGSVRGSANAITVWSGLIPRRGLIGQWYDREQGRLVCYCSAVQAFIDPPRNTDQHLVVVSRFLIFPMGLVKIAVGCSAPPPTARSYPHGASVTERSGKIKSFTSTKLTAAATCNLRKALFWKL